MEGASSMAAARRRGRRVMVGIDESKESTYALQWTLDNLLLPPAPTCNNQELDIVTLVHVVPNLHHDIYPLGPVGYTGPVVTDSMKKAQQDKAAAVLEGALHLFKEAATAQQVKAETLILEGDAKDMLCQATEDMHVDLLVVGSRGLGRIKRTLLGSVSDYCAHHSSCPLLIVKPFKQRPASVAAAAPVSTPGLIRFG